MDVEFIVVRCPRCNAVVLDALRLRGLVRVKCQGVKCRRRVWIQGRGSTAEVVRVDKRPERVKVAA